MCACVRARVCVCRLSIICLFFSPSLTLFVNLSLFLSFPASLLALLTALRDLSAMLTWPLLTLALCYSKLILLIRAQSKAKMWEPHCVITLLALQTLGTRDVCRSHTELGMVLCRWPHWKNKVKTQFESQTVFI